MTVITTPILSFIEEVMIKYNLEDNLIDDDPFLKKNLSEVTDLSDRFALKLIFGEKIQEQKTAGKSLEEILPSMRLKKIIDSLVNKKISYEELPELIKKELLIDDSKANEISKMISNNTEIIKLIKQPKTEETIEENEEENRIEEKIDTTNKKSIANILLK